MKQHVEQLRMLWQLQELDQQILQEEHRSQNIESVNDHRQKKNALLTFQRTLEEEEEELVRDKKELRHKELELQSLADLLEKLQHKLYSGKIHNAKELESLEKRVRSNQGEKSKIEDEILQLMESIEQAEEVLLARQNFYDGEKEMLQQLGTRAQRDLRLARVNLNLLKQQREELKREIGPALLDKYNELSRHLRGRCISLVQQGFCGICNVSLPSSFRARLLTPGQLVFCENCGCLLVPAD